MSEAKFTKGPWVIGGTCHEDFRNCVCIDAQIRNVNTPTELAVIFGIDDGFTSDEESIANAQLIAAAPEMYNEIESEINNLNSLLIGVDPSSLESAAIEKKIKRKSELLAKARGEHES